MMEDRDVQHRPGDRVETTSGGKEARRDQKTQNRGLPELHLKNCYHEHGASLNAADHCVQSNRSYSKLLETVLVGVNGVDNV